MKYKGTLNYAVYKRLLNRHYQAIRRSGDRVSKWANIEQIKQFYLACPVGCEVDHIIPCAGDRVTGLHVIENLQYMLKSKNRKKCNRYDLT